MKILRCEVAMKTLSQLQEMIEHQQRKIKVLEAQRQEDRESILRMQGRLMAMELGESHRVGPLDEECG